jgi:DnaJ-class molecular chaperone
MQSNYKTFTAKLIANANARFATSKPQFSPGTKEKDYYFILGVPSTATLEQIKEAYRVSVKKYHPDVVGSEEPDSAKFRDVMEAYGILSIRESRASYDLLRKKNP